jgi:hypothetical protein
VPVEKVWDRIRRRCGFIAITIVALNMEEVPVKGLDSTPSFAENQYKRLLADGALKFFMAR